MRILREDVVETRPTLETTAYSIVLTYQTSDIPSATIMIPVSELFPDKEEDFVKQYRERKGDLYAEWRKKRLEIIRKDLKERRERIPEKVLV